MPGLLRDLYRTRLKKHIPKEWFLLYHTLRRQTYAVPSRLRAATGVNDLEKYFRNNPGNLIHKYDHYFEIYDRHFSRFRGKPIVLLEVGVYHGGSLQMWKAYFGPDAKIYGIDINPECKKFEEPGIEIFIGSQSDRAFLRDVKQKIPKVDILIDDGGHTMDQQIVTFEEMFEHVKGEGVYLAEDLATSYWEEYGGGYQNQKSFIEYSKNFIDRLNAWHSRETSLRVDAFTRSADSLHYYDGVLVIEKGGHPEPVSHMSGIPSL